MSSLQSVYVWCNKGKGTDFQEWMAMAEDGEVITTHVCSHESWARTDMHDRKAEEYTEKFGGHGDGEFYNLVWEVPPDDVYQRNQALGRAAKAEATKERVQ